MNHAGAGNSGAIEENWNANWYENWNGFACSSGTPFVEARDSYGFSVGRPSFVYAQACPSRTISRLMSTLSMKTSPTVRP